MKAKPASHKKAKRAERHAPLRRNSCQKDAHLMLSLKSCKLLLQHAGSNENAFIPKAASCESTRFLLRVSPSASHASEAVDRQCWNT